MVGVDRVHPLGMKIVLRKVSFSRQFRTPDRITRRVSGVWLLPFPVYFNCDPFFLNIPNLRSPLRDQLMFMSRKDNPFSVIILTLSFFSEGGRFIQFFHIYDVNCRCWFSAALSNIC